MAELKHTPLHSLHVELGARMVAFAGYDMPVQYAGGIREEHMHTRQQASLFDISHMGQVNIRGKSAKKFIQGLVPADITGLEKGQQRYTVFTNEEGGVIDDLMITDHGDFLFLVLNAACKDKDMQYLQSAVTPGIEILHCQDMALLALQGPASAAILESLLPGTSDLAFMQGAGFRFNDNSCLVNRCGYTGEDGFEIAVGNDQVEQLARALLANELVEPAGLGARDTLRLEAGLCLYGHELDEDTTPVEAGLGWTIAERFRTCSDIDADVPGLEKLLVQLVQGTDRVLVGLLAEGKMPIREDTLISDISGEDAGRVTSGGFGPSVNRPVAMAYVREQYSVPGMTLQASVRDKLHNVQVCKLPFVEHRYHKTRGQVL